MRSYDLTLQIQPHFAKFAERTSRFTDSKTAAKASVFLAQRRLKGSSLRKGARAGRNLTPNKLSIAQLFAFERTKDAYKHNDIGAEKCASGFLVSCPVACHDVPPKRNAILL